MRTRSSSNLVGESSPNPTTSNLKRRNRRRSKQPFILEESPLDTMADQRTMAELLCAPTEGYAGAIVVLPILAEHFELKHSLINMMTSNQFFRLEKYNPHDHIRWFNKITSTIKYKDAPNLEIKLMLFPLSLAGAARHWLDKEPSRFILTWEDLVSKFINEFFPPSRTTNLHNEISNFQQWFYESFHEACDHYIDLLRACPHHGFTELHQLNTFYNALNPTDQDSLNSAAGGNLLERCTHDVLTIIENKSNVKPRIKVDECNLADPNNDLADTIPKMFTDEHTLDYSSLPLYDDVDDDLVELESDNDDVYDDPFDSKEDKIKKSKLLIDKLDPPRSSDFLPSPECDSVLYEDFSEVDALPSTNNEDKDFNPPLYELPFHKEVPWSKTILSFSSENEEKVFNPRILTSKGVHTSLLSELSHRGPKAFKVIKNFESPMEIFPYSYGEDNRILDVPCLHFYPP
nr:reverse transcriptase domain-containing protein [Tanacetum cinerariifolium]